MFEKGRDTKKFENPWVNGISYGLSQSDPIKQHPLCVRNKKKIAFLYYVLMSLTIFLFCNTSKPLQSNLLQNAFV